MKPAMKDRRNVIDKVSKLLPGIYDAIKKELVLKVDEKYKGSF